jgi:hypothetical protein
MEPKRTNKETRTVLFHTADLAKKKQLQQLCRALKIGTRELKDSDGDRRLAQLLVPGRKMALPVTNEKQSPKRPLGYHLPELLVFSGFSGEDLDAFLAQYKADGIAPTPLKAIVTPHNYNWSLYELVSELERERMEFLLHGRS